MVKSRLWVMSLASAIAVISWAPNGVAQEKPIPPGKAPVPAGHDPMAPITRAEAERRTTVRSTLVPIRATAPDSMAFFEFRARAKRAAEPPRGIPASPSIQDLIEIVRRRPGGPQLIERARRAGANIPSAGSSTRDALSRVATVGGPSSSDATFAATFTSPTALPPITATVTRSNPSVTVAGVGQLNAQAIYPLYATSDNVWGPLDRVFYGHSPVGGSFLARSWVSIGLNAQTTGWYLINVQATPIAAEMRLFSVSTPVGYNVIQLFPIPPIVGGYGSYPVLLYLAAGWHSLSWVNRDFFAWVAEVSATRM